MKVRTPHRVAVHAVQPIRILPQLAAGYLAFTTLIGLWLWLGWGGPYVIRVVDDLASLIASIFAAACAWYAARCTTGRLRTGWLALAAGAGAWAIGDAIWGYYEVLLQHEQAPAPSLADAGYLLFPVGAGAAALLLSPGDRGQSRKRLVVDGVIVAVSFFVIAWVFVLDDVFRAGGDNRMALVVAVAYPVTDVAVITIAWARTAAAYRPSLGLLVAGLIIIGMSDGAYAALTAVDGYKTGNLIDLGWIAGLGVLGLAALRSRGEPSTGATQVLVSPRVRLWLPYLPVVVAFAVGLGEALPMLSSVPLAVAGCILIAGVLARQFMVLADNQRLLEDVGRLAFHDQLTGLANRALFLDRLERALARQGREQERLAVLCLDLDDFKAVNDELGHPAGDELLIRIAQLLSGCVRHTDTVARLGGDEFAVLIEGATVETAVAAADRILAAFHSRIVIDNVALTVRPSIGLTMTTADPSHTSVDDLIRQADLAMYAAKRDGGGSVRSFVPDLPDPFDLSKASESAAEPEVTAVDPAPAADAGESPQQTSAAYTRWPPLGARIAIGLLVVGVVVFAISILVRPHPGRMVLFDNWLESALVLAAAGLVAVRAWRFTEERRAWLLIAAGMTATAMATVVYAIWVPEGQLPSAAALTFSLAFYPLAYPGLLLLIRSRLPSVPAAIKLDGPVVAFAVAAVGTALVSGAVHTTVNKQSPGMMLVGLAYPIGGVLLLALATASIAFVDWRTEWRWGLIITGFAMWVVAGVVYLVRMARGSYLEGTWLDVCWLVAFIMLAAASWLPSAPATASLRKAGPGLLVLPLVSTVAALAVAIFASDDRLAVTLAALTLIAVAARFAVTFRDVTAVAESHQLAMTDELTGLANLRALATALTAAPFDERTAGWDRTRSRLGLLLLEVDQFTHINDSLGRRVGDDLLCRIGRRVARSVRPQDLVARSGDHEFAVMLANEVDLMTARAIADSLLEALHAPFALNPITVQVDAHVAIALWPDHCSHPQELLGRAQATLARVRSTGDNVAVYDPSADDHNTDDVELEHDLRAALSDDVAASPEHGGLTCYYQPKISARGDQVHSVEALVRWHHPTRGLLLPDQFLPIAERIGVMRSVTARVLDIALAQISAWRDQGTALTVAVNLSTTNLIDVGLVETIGAQLLTHGVPADALILEITESTLTTDSQRSRSTVSALRQLGIRLSLDDYGTGWSSLARLQDLSVDELKLDQVFVAQLARDPRSIAIVRSTVALAHSLGADLVAEGVEDETTLRALRQYGCTITQGHVHSPPLPADQFQQWLSDWKPARLRRDNGRQAPPDRRTTPADDPVRSPAPS